MRSAKEKQTLWLSAREISDLPTMSTAVELGQFIKISCTWCRVSHCYDPADLKQLLGDVPFVNIEIHFRCSDCGKKEYMMAYIENPPARERVGTTVRRLVEIRTVRRPVWKDVKL